MNKAHSGTHKTGVRIPDSPPLSPVIPVGVKYVCVMFSEHKGGRSETHNNYTLITSGFYINLKAPMSVNVLFI